MPWSNQSGGGGGPWGGGGNNGSGGPWGQPPRGGKGGGGGGQPPDLEDILRKGQDRLKTILPNGSGSGSGGTPRFVWVLILVVIGGLYLWQCLYRVQPDQVGVVMLFGKAKEGLAQPGMHFHFWPFETVETPALQKENIERIGVTVGRGSQENGLMLSGDQNIIDIRFTVLWVISDPKAFLFNVLQPENVVRLVAESAMREYVGRSRADAVRTEQRQEVEDNVRRITQETLDSYGAGITISSVNLEQADPPQEVNEAFEEVQRAEQDRERFQQEAQRYSNEKLGTARGQASQIREQAQGYKERVVAEAEGEAQRFTAVLEEYQKAPDVTRRRLYFETMERVLGSSEKVILEEGAGGGPGGGGVVPYLPLPEVQRRRSDVGGQ